MSYAETLSKHRRLTILRALNEAPGYTANESLLNAVCNDFGVTTNRDQMAAELAWLEEQQLISLEDIAGLKVARITERGQDVAAGKASHPGVKRPGP